MPDTNISPATPSAEDLAWAESFERKIVKTFRARTARAMLADNLYAAIENKQSWRLDHLLSRTFERNSWPFSGMKLDGKTMRAIENDFMWNRREDLAKDFPLVTKNIRRSLASLAVAAAWPEGVSKLMAHDLTQMGELRDCICASVANDDAPTTRALIAMVPPETQARWQLDNAILETAVDKNKATVLEDLAKDRPSLLEGTAVGWAASEKASPALTDFVFAKQAEAVKTAVAAGPGLLVWALRSRNSYAALKLIDAGADVNATTAEFRMLPSMLQLAVTYGLPEVVSALLDKGADPAYRDLSGKSAVTGTFGNAPSWENAEKALAVLAERAKIEPEDAKKLLLHIGAGSAIYPAIRKIAQAQATVEPGSSWRTMGPEQVGMVSSDKASGVQITELFNFATGEHLIVSRDAAAQKDSLLVRENFADVKNTAALEAARAHLAPKAPSA